MKYSSLEDKWIEKGLEGGLNILEGIVRNKWITEEEMETLRNIKPNRLPFPVLLKLLLESAPEGEHFNRLRRILNVP